MLMRRLMAAAAGMALACSAHAEPPTAVLVTQTVQTLTAATDTPLTGTGRGIRMLCVQNLGSNAVSLAFDTAAVAGSGWLLAASGGSKCWDAGVVPTSVVHAISTSGSTVATLVGR